MERYKCTGCGDSRPCFVETNEEVTNIDEIDDLVCILDSTNKTSYNWKRIPTPLAMSSEDIDPEINKIVNENFWDLIEPTNMEKITLSAYWKLLNAHDWLYEYTEDHNVYLRGAESLKKVYSYKALGQEYADLFKAFKAHYRIGSNEPKPDQPPLEFGEK